MTNDAHTQELLAKHARLEQEIAEEERRPVPDSLRITALKKQKLQIKDQIAALSAR